MWWGGGGGRGLTLGTALATHNVPSARQHIDGDAPAAKQRRPHSVANVLQPLQHIRIDVARALSRASPFHQLLLLIPYPAGSPTPSSPTLQPHPGI